MYVDSYAAPTRRSAGVPHLRSARREASPQTANAGRPRPATVAARRTRVADAIVSQWLLEQLPSDHRHASDRRRELGVQPAEKR